MIIIFKKICVIICLLLTLFSCCRPHSKVYNEFYSHTTFPQPQNAMSETPYFLVILVNARHLDYTDNASFLKTVAKHPDDRSKTGDVGHAWIYLKGEINGKDVVIEGGHSGEVSSNEPKYFDGIMNYNEFGYPTYNGKCSYEPNPVKYLLTKRTDGFFQRGSGGHQPTFAAKIDLTEEEFQKILFFIHPKHYSYQNYSLVEDQCSTFVVKVAALAGLSLEDKLSMPIQPAIRFRHYTVRLWEDPQFKTLTLSTPDLLEKSLMQAVQEGKAQYALNWYLKKNHSN